MFNFKKDQNTRDIVIKNGRISMVDDTESISQNCDSAMRQHLGELRFYQKKGIDYINNVFMANPNFQAFESQARKAVLNVEGVKSVISLSYSVKANTLTYDLVIKTDKERLNLNGNI